MRKALCFIFCLILASSPVLAKGQGVTVSFVNVPSTLTPGALSPIVFSVSEASKIRLTVQSPEMEAIAIIAQEYSVSAGETTLGWDGTYFGEAVKEGDYTLLLQAGSASVTTPVHIGAPLPMFTQVLLSDLAVTNDAPFSITLSTNIEARLTFSIIAGGETYDLDTGMVSQTPTTIKWNGTVNNQPLANGEYTLQLTLSDKDTGVVAVNEHYPITVSLSDAPLAVPVSATIESAAFTPAMTSPHACAHENCYWNTPMDITDEAAVWAMLMAPMTVIDGDQKKQIKLMSEPDANSTPIADITCASQSVHVLEHLDNGWSLVETYSSSFHDSNIKAWNAFSQGYVKTSLLKEKAPGNKEYGIVVDKLTQRLYLFKNGTILAELLCSTGLPNKTQPYNETRSGEFFLLSPIGEFSSDNLRCSFGIRFNDGDILHEVPHLDNADGTNNYRNTEPKLGTRASHGCVRVQRLKNPDGINMKWIWNEIYKGIASKTVKFVIWEDYNGRQIPLPDPETKVYYNSDGGTNYHRRETCQGVKDKYLPLSSFAYKELDTAPYASLTPCGYCVPLLRVTDINAINDAHKAD